ncbi:hypothetical protein CEXT_398581 [Caerostris extrusa]|uniref:Uncharacterized protein n=1 Tax=Caerostris extrusa TaxID=172846 RepID=A0AAV4T3R2_CAEEX|nr:hypothetical protein CEXT_398581 [Caerostris extrusa]
MKFSLPYLLFLITCCYASVKTRGNMLDIKGSWKDAFDTGMCFQEATSEDSRSLFEVEDNLVLWGKD